MSIKLIKIGRSPKNDVIINDESVSRFHLELFQDADGNVFITDLGSTNGTTVNGRKLVDSEILKSTDVVKVGSASPIQWKSYFTLPIEKDIDIEDQFITINTKSKKKQLLLIVILSFILVLVCVILLNNKFFPKDSKNKESIIKLDTIGKTKKSEGGEVTIKPHRDDIPEKNKRNIPEPTSGVITYSYDCMDQSLINTMSDFETGFIDGSGEVVTLSEEREAGKQLYNGCLVDYKFINDNRLKKIKTIKNNLQKVIIKPRGFNYSIYLLETDEINAFTAGGYIFVTTGMLNFTRNDDELACVIGHEMAHNERNHINQHLKKAKVNNAIFGDVLGDAAAALTFFVTTPFNQKKETECDFYGIDYATQAGYNSCSAIDLWKRMSFLDSEGDKIDEMMRTHPYSSKRSICCGEHISANYNFNCP